MNKEGIIESNKLIAEFMGYEYYGWNDEKHRASGYTSGYWGKKDAKLHHLKLPATMLFNPLLYHSSYDWLIPVVDKIQELGWNFRLNSYFEKNGVHCNFYKSMVDILSDNKVYTTKIEAIYSVVVYFIKQHNEQKLKK